MRAITSTLVLGLLQLTGCDSLPTDPAPELAPAVSGPSQPLKALRVYTLSDGTVVRSYTERFTETGQPCNEVVTITGTSRFVTSYRESDGQFELNVLITAFGSGYGHTSLAPYYKYYVNYQTDLGRIDGSPEREFTLVQSYRIFRLGEDAADDDAMGHTYYHIKVNNLGEILSLQQSSASECA